MKKALITGITGQDGLYLAELLISKGYQVWGMVRGQNNPKADLIRRELPAVKIVHGDLSDFASLVRILEVSDPDEIYNLGAISFVSYSWELAQLTSQVTGLGVTNLLEAIRVWKKDNFGEVKFYQASSSEMFGKVTEIPQNESTRFWPRSPYGVSKVYGHMMTINYRESYGLHASSGILFNHESPRRGLEFVTRKISSTVAKIHYGLESKLLIGNLDSKRDWGFAGDYVEAMWLMLQQEEPSDYVISTGKVFSVKDFIQLAFSKVGIENWEKYVHVDSSLFRPAEVDFLLGDSSKAKKVLGWEPKIQFEGLVQLMVESDLKLYKPQ